LNQLTNHNNYNCEVTTETGEKFKIFADWLHNTDNDHWKGWSCQAGANRIYIDKNLDIWGGMCKNDYLGTGLDFNLLDSTTCNRDTCTGCTDDLTVTKHAPK